MSRCFPYPPPGYTRKGARVEAALIESIKLQSEREKCKTDRRKEKRRDKKQKRKEHKGKSFDGHESRDGKLNDLKGQKKKKSTEECENLQKGAKNESEQVEKSGLTEEHGQPICPQSPGYLSDGTQNSHKRKRGAPPNEDCKPGKIIRIKLASRKHQESDLSLVKEQTCSTSGCDKFFAPKRGENNGEPIQEIATNSDAVASIKSVTSKSKTESSLSLHSVKKISSQRNDMLLHSVKNSAETAYEALFEKWVPPPLQLEQYADDEEWLFGTRQQHGQTTKINKAICQIPSSSLWPREQYLPEADIYSLPYTIPY